MDPLFEQNAHFQKLADQLLADSKLISILEKYGRVMPDGSHAYGLMMHGDIDIHILRDTAYSKEETLQIFGDIFRSTGMQSYYIGDWNNSLEDAGKFPTGYYIGLKTKYGGANWKIDLWFLSTEDEKSYKSKHFDISAIVVTPAQKKAILEFKKYRNDNKLKVSGQQIYEMVARDGVLNIEDFKKIISKK
jgi:hypothetical protein